MFASARLKTQKSGRVSRPASRCTLPLSHLSLARVSVSGLRAKRKPKGPKRAGSQVCALCGARPARPLVRAEAYARRVRARRGLACGIHIRVQLYTSAVESWLMPHMMTSSSPGQPVGQPAVSRAPARPLPGPACVCEAPPRSYRRFHAPPPHLCAMPAALSTPPESHRLDRVSPRPASSAQRASLARRAPRRARALPRALRRPRRRRRGGRPAAAAAGGPLAG